ncbi:MAG: S8 family serine peptidase [Ignavibacteriae bacterium]|nr:S8 family serine peptidase [Ignavibacteriota bacterium]
MQKLIKTVSILFLSAIAIFAGEGSQSFLSLRPTGVEDFLSKHSEFDGRGTIIFVLDTGVDQGIEGLIKTSTGDVKVIDVQDFTGQGDIKLFEADYEEDDGMHYFLNEDENLKVAGANSLSLKPIDDQYFIGVLNEKLWTNSSSGAKDVNGNGRFDDKFHIVVFETKAAEEQYWVAFFDSNSDGDLSDELPIRNYKENFDSFEIPNEAGLSNFTIGLNIFPDEKKVNFHFDDGAHGTHCAGIAAGNSIGGNEFNGVAPGAKVISLKIGNNNFSGGATVTESMKRAYLYADKVSKEREEPCIINMSYGIGSEIEGQSDMELFLDDLLKKNPYLYVCTSNGNEGPGISTAGLPSSAKRVFSSGAVLTKGVAAANYGSVIDDDIILYFSSRGGEVPKPDIVSPGASTSTVPNWEDGDKYWGTSMASPYTAGVVSLLLSAVKVEFPDIKIPSGLLFKAIRESAVKLDGYTHLDQGSGYINAVNAHQTLKDYIKNNEVEKYEEYSISTLAPNMPNGSGESLYLRNGKYLTGKETVSFSINRDNVINKDKFYRIYNLSSDSDWLIPIQKNVYIRNDQSASVQVKFDVDKIKKPGLYNGQINAYRSKGSKIKEFSLMATVVIPYQFTFENDFKKSFTGSLAPGKIERYFIDIPAGASAMRITLESIEGKYAGSKFRVHDPDGRRVYVSPTLYALDTKEKMNHTIYDLSPGVYEVVATGFYKAKDTSNYKLKIDFENVNVVENKILTAENNFIEIINNSNKVKNFTAKGLIEGKEKDYTVNIAGIKTIPFVMTKDMSKKVFNLSLSKKEYNQLTDFAALVLDEEDKAVAKSSLSYREGELVFKNKNYKDSTNYRLKLIPGFVHAESSFSLDLKEKTYFRNKESFKVKNSGSSIISIYPSQTQKLICEYYMPDILIDADEIYFGRVILTPKTKSNIKQELPVHIKLSEEAI